MRCTPRNLRARLPSTALVLILIVATLGRSAAAEPVWRPFSDDSPWNQRIAADSPSDPESRALIEDFASRGALFINIADWSIPVYFVDSDATPRHDVGDSRPGIYGQGFEFPRRIPIPVGAVASPPIGDHSDNHLCIIDRAKKFEWGMWAARKNAAGRWFTGLGAVTDLSSTGVAPPWFSAPRELDAHRARAGGFPLVAGLMFVDEIKARRIEHALVFAYDHCRTGTFVPPASTSQSPMPGTAKHRGIPMGGRIQLDPAWDVENSGLSSAGKTIARALQEYGAFCGDYAGANVLYAENSPAAVAAWEGVLHTRELESVFTPEMIRKNFRVVAMGNLLPGQNFELPPPYVLSFAADGETAPARIDQLARTIHLSPPRSSDSARIRVRWTLHPRETSARTADRELPHSPAELSLAPNTPLALTLTAPDGSTNTWRIVRASTTP